MTLSQPRPTTYARHYAQEPQAIEPDGSRTWVTRAANFVIAVTEVDGSATLERDNPDESMVVLPLGVAATVTAPDGTREVDGDSLVIMPPGPGRIVVAGSGPVARILSCRAVDLAALASNAATYRDGAPEVAPLVPWPDPVDGFRTRVYRLADYHDAAGGMIQPRIFRSTNLMINVFVPWHAIRDTSRLSPHWHDDFEQASLTLEGKFVHHIRTPWGPDLGAWRQDEHVEIGSPSVTIIPATLIHTTRNPDVERACLIDVFAPPRFDFSLRQGLVRNADEYPMPAGDHEADGQRGSPSSWQ